MTREEIIEKLRAMEPDLRARGITRMQMFGSRARGDQRPDSDLDLLIDLDPTRRLSLFDVSGMRLEVTDRLGIDANIIEGRGLQDRFRNRIQPDLVMVFA